jgi:metal-responsive CopG/Arc/MetJ family transcriptional regulator
MRKLIVSVALSPDVVAKLDNNRGRGAKISRSNLIETAIRNYLHELETAEVLPHAHTKKALVA